VQQVAADNKIEVVITVHVEGFNIDSHRLIGQNGERFCSGAAAQRDVHTEGKTCLTSPGFGAAGPVWNVISVEIGHCRVPRTYQTQITRCCGRGPGWNGCAEHAGDNNYEYLQNVGGVGLAAHSTHKNKGPLLYHKVKKLFIRNYPIRAEKAAAYKYLGVRTVAASVLDPPVIQMSVPQNSPPNGGELVGHKFGHELRLGVIAFAFRGGTPPTR